MASDMDLRGDISWGSSAGLTTGGLNFYCLRFWHHFLINSTNDNSAACLV